MKALVSTRERSALFGEAALLAVTLALTGAASRQSDWGDPVLLGLLLAAGMTSDLLGMRAKRMRVSGGFFTIVIAAALLGPAPAVAIGIALNLVDHAVARTGLRKLVGNLATYATFTLIGSLLLRLVATSARLEADSLEFALVVFAAFIGMNFANFALVAAHFRLIDERLSLREMFMTLFVPVLPSQLAAAALAAGVAALYGRIGVLAIAAMAVALLTFQYLMRELLRSQERAEELALRSHELASLQVGVLTAMIQTLSLRDRMTARHCAAVARYAREIAREAGMSEAEQELVHTAGLLHDIGKFIFPDAILVGNSKLTDEQYEIVKRHPAQGARVVRKIDGYGPIADIILAHHERIDGRGYPHGIAGDDIPALSRIISVADTYDVMTARDSYREPVPPSEAIAELHRVAGSQLDARFVELFIRVLERKGIGFQHADDADFEAELAFEARVREHAEPRVLAA